MPAAEAISRAPETAPEPVRNPTKGERSRERLKQAARQVLGERGFRAARVTDITQAAGLSQGAFYPYFKNKREIFLEVVREFIDEGRAVMHAAPRGDDPFDQIHAPTRAYVDLLFAQAPLVRAVLQAADDDDEFAGLWQDTTHAWLAQVAHRIRRRCGDPEVEAETPLLVAYAVNWMVDGFLHSLLGRRDPHQEAVIRSPEHLAEALSVLWFRAVYGCDPDPAQLNHARDILELRFVAVERRTGGDTTHSNRLHSRRTHSKEGAR
ncbi:MAG: TetR/AcrR family transcriptional regulator [Myxococcota bacterium]|jgi:AcrR family transcriptional regulator|nr:TetR/AcrR family transcriptional regulator [Myxococcota bacterium]